MKLKCYLSFLHRKAINKQDCFWMIREDYRSLNFDGSSAHKEQSSGVMQLCTAVLEITSDTHFYACF